MKQEKYESYGEYVKIQTTAYYDKINKVWAKKDTIKFISDFIVSKIPDIKKGLCHGSRKGNEVKWFRKFLKCKDIYGTEIAESRNKYIIEWDFHNLKEEWLNSMDFIYSNSLDHAYDPKKCINFWCKCLKENGFLILEHSLQHEKSTKVDPFGIDYQDLVDIIFIWTNGEYIVKYEFNSPGKQYEKRKAKILFIGKFNS